MHKNLRMLREAPEGQELEVDGKSATTIKGLSKMLPMISESAFRYHQAKGDFSNWMMRVFGDIDLAQQIREIRTKHFMKRQIDARLKQLKRSPFSTTRL